MRSPTLQGARVTIWNQPISEETGVCKAKPIISEKRPRETNNEYQLLIRKEIKIKITINMVNNRIKRTILYTTAFVQETFVMMPSIILEAISAKKLKKAPSKKFKIKFRYA